MRRGRSILVLAAATAVAVGGVLTLDREPDTAARSGELVFPALLDQVNAVARVRVTGHEGTFTLARDGQVWVVEEKERHPVEPDKMHNLVIGAAGMKRVEPKTGNPDLYPKIRLEDPSGEDAKSARFVFEDASGAELANWVLGDRRPSKSDPARTEIYIRVGDDPQAWLVEGSVPGGRTIIDWLDRLVARIDRQRLRAVEVAHAGGAVVAVRKTLPTDVDFTLDRVPEGREIDARYRINDIGRFLEDLRFEDVVPASTLDFPGSVDKRVRITTFDGLRIHLETVMRDGEAFARLQAEVDETLAEAAKAARAAEGEVGSSGGEGGKSEGDAGSEETDGAEAMGDASPEGENGGGSEGGTGSEEADGAEAVGDASPESGADTESEGEAGAQPKDVTGPLLSLDDVRAGAGKLNARWAGWAYELPSFKRDSIDKRIDELTRPLEEQDEGQEGGDH